MPRPKILEPKAVVTVAESVTMEQMTVAVKAAGETLRALGPLDLQVKMPRGAFGA